MGVLIQFDRTDKDNKAITILEESAHSFGYKIGRYGEMTVAMYDENGDMVSVHTGVRSAWNLPATVPADPTTAFDISSMPKKAE